MRNLLGFVLIALGILGPMPGPAGAPNRPPLGRLSPALPSTRPQGSARTIGPSVEARIRRLAADQLGVDADELTAEVSLTDDLAADSLDLLELVLGVESEFGIGVPERRIDALRTYRDLVEIVLTGLDGQERRAQAISPALPVRSRVVPPAGRASVSLERADRLTPYALEIFASDATHAGPGARLELTLPASAANDQLVLAHDRLARLGRHGVDVSVRRDPAWNGDEASVPNRKSAT